MQKFWEKIKDSNVVNIAPYAVAVIALFSVLTIMTITVIEFKRLEGPPPIVEITAEEHDSPEVEPWMIGLVREYTFNKNLIRMDVPSCNAEIRPADGVVAYRRELDIRPHSPMGRYIKLELRPYGFEFEDEDLRNRDHLFWVSYWIGDKEYKQSHEDWIEQQLKDNIEYKQSLSLTPVKEFEINHHRNAVELACKADDLISEYARSGLFSSEYEINNEEKQ